MYVNDIFMTENWTGQERTLSPVKIFQEPSFLQPRVHYFPPYLTQKLTKS